MEVIIKRSHKPDKKFDAIIDNKKTVAFGAKGMADFTLHKDPERKARYIARHKSNEDWANSGIKTAGFYAKHVLWNKPTLQASVNDLNHRYKNIKFILKN
jgi:hypothetical protein